MQKTSGPLPNLNCLNRWNRLRILFFKTKSGHHVKVSCKKGIEVKAATH